MNKLFFSIAAFKASVDGIEAAENYLHEVFGCKFKLEKENGKLKITQLENLP